MRSILIPFLIFIIFSSCTKGAVTNNDISTTTPTPTTIAKQLLFTGNGFSNNGILEIKF